MMIKKTIAFILFIAITFSLCACNASNTDNKPHITRPTEEPLETKPDESFGWTGQEMDFPKFKDFESKDNLVVTHFGTMDEIITTIVENEEIKQYFGEIFIEDAENLVFSISGQPAYSQIKTIMLNGKHESCDIVLYNQVGAYSTVNAIRLIMQSNALTKTNQDLTAKVLSAIDSEIGEFAVRANDFNMITFDKEELDDPTRLSERIPVKNGYYIVERIMDQNNVIIDITAVADDIPNNNESSPKELIFNEINYMIDLSLGNGFGSDSELDKPSGRYPINNEKFGDMFAIALLGDGAYITVNEINSKKLKETDSVKYEVEIMYDVMKEQDAILQITHKLYFQIKENVVDVNEGLLDCDNSFTIKFGKSQIFDSMTHDERVALIARAADILQPSTSFDGLDFPEQYSVMQMEIPYQFFVNDGEAGLELINDVGESLTLTFNP